MKRIKLLIYVSSMLCASSLTLSSCSNFLNEDYTTALSLQSYETTEGLDGLVVGLYSGLDFHYNYTWAFATTNYGTDEFNVGSDRTEERWNSYNSSLNSQDVYVKNVWDNMYGNIATANIGIKNIPTYYTNSSTKDVRLGECYFMRAFDYYTLLKQFGGVPLKLSPSETVEYEFSRNSEQEVFAQIISDFSDAYKLLPDKPEATGRITKWAAAHFLAKVYLTRASELYSSWNSSTQANDLDQTIAYANSVINTSGKTLAPNFSDLWNFTTVNGVNENLSEVILSAQFSDNTATQGRYGNQVHLYFPSIYRDIPGMVRDIPGGREFCRLRTTDYSMDVYDRVNDSRFWKSFKTEYLCNLPSKAPLWTVSDAPSPSLVGTPRYMGGEPAIQYIINNAGDNRYIFNASSPTYQSQRAPNLFVRYFSGEAMNMKNNHGNYGSLAHPDRFVALSKFLDGSRNSVNSQFGQRDGILARLAETYLIAAEAYGRKGEYDQALPYINAVRDRAAYKASEDREQYSDGGVAYENNPVMSGVKYVSYSPKSTYYESNNIPVSTASTYGAMHLNSTADIFNSTHEFYNELGATDQKSKFITFILNERSRELMGELMRWSDLVRTKTLVSRCRAFNDEANPDPGTHYLRPIPQSFLDAIQSNGHALSPSEKQAMQNPGY